MKKGTVFFFLVLQLSGCLCISLNAIPHDDDSKSEALPSPRSLVENCEGIFNPTCLKLKFISFIDGLSKSEYTIFNGINIVKDADADKSQDITELEEISRSFPDEPDKRVDSYLMYKIGSFFENHSLKFKFIGDESARGLLDAYEDDDDDEEEYEEEDDGRRIRMRRKGGKRRGGRKKKKGLALILAIGAIIKGVFGAISTGVLFLIAGKALVTSLIALAISGILAIKKVAMKEEGGAAAPVKIHHSHHDDYYPYARSIEIKLPEHLSKPEA